MRKVTKTLLKSVHKELIDKNQNTYDIYLKSVIIDYIYDIEDIIKWAKNKNINSLRYQILLNRKLCDFEFILGHDTSIYEVSKNDYIKIFSYAISKIKGKYEKRIYLNQLNNFIESEIDTDKYNSDLNLLLSLPGLIPTELDGVL